MRIFCLALIALTVITGCQSPGAPATGDPDSERNVSNISINSPEDEKPAAFHLSDQFGDYWYQGEAELTSYTLQQARYDELHQGEAVLIFVTEDLSKNKQVKLDDPERSPEDKVNVLKLNSTRRFNTGIYTYSMMTSTFTPVQRQSYPHTLKVTATAQEWCGHTFTQLNLKRNKYALRSYSYFESEGDRALDLDDALLEDELWTLIRLDPASLPTGRLQLIPGTMYQRLSHGEWEVLEATASLEAGEVEGTMIYTISYPERQRTLKIQFNKAFPHEIEGWEDTYRSGRGADAPVLTTRAERKKRIKLDYWNRNGTEDNYLRKELALDQ